MLSSSIIKIGEFIYRIYPYTIPERLEMGNAYSFGGDSKTLKIRYKYVLPFRGKLSKDCQEPGIYLNKSGDIYVIHPKSSADRLTYNINRCMEITPNNINGELNKYLREIDANDLRYNGNIFVPKIKENDDVGIKAIRLALTAKHMDFGSYKNRFDKPWAVSNTRKALLTDTTLTFTKLDEYSKIFDFDFGIILFDKSHAKDPMCPDGKALVVFNNEEFALNDPNIRVVRTVEDVLDAEMQDLDEGDIDDLD